MISPAKQVMFLFNHDAAHQAAHTAGIMGELAASKPQLDVVAATGNPAIERQIRDLIPASQAQAVRWLDLSLPRLWDQLLALPNKIAPVIRLARLHRNIDAFSKADIIVSPERTCLRVKRRLVRNYGSKATRFAYVPHGSGDRNVAYNPELVQFDYYLLSGQKLIDEMVAHGLATAEDCHLIGYAKFDVAGDTPKAKLFDNDRPTIVYNPHFDPKLSSWFDHGPEFLRWVAGQSDRFNCVFAPHVMLFRKKLHISPEYKISRNRPEIPAEAYAAENILIDTDSPRLFDMTYTNSADIYVGDVSSQIYEFLKQARPAYFIDAAEQGQDAYQFWQNGPVVKDIPQLEHVLINHAEVGKTYRTTQERLFDYTINIDPERSAAQRGADVLAGLVNGE